MHISDSVEADVLIDADSAHDATNSAFNALSQFACKTFPPPESVSISVSEDGGEPIATVKFSFEITYAKSRTETHAH